MKKENIYLKSIIGSWFACWYNEVVKNNMKTYDQHTRVCTKSVRPNSVIRSLFISLIIHIINAVDPLSISHVCSTIQKSVVNTQVHFNSLKL